MSKYELDLDDDQAARLIEILLFTRTSGALSPSKAALAMTAARLIREQMPTPEPDHEYLIKDNEGDIWRWDVRQAAWECTTHRSERPAFCQWRTVAAEYSPVTLYAQIPS